MTNQPTHDKKLEQDEDVVADIVAAALEGRGVDPTTAPSSIEPIGVSFTGDTMLVTLAFRFPPGTLGVKKNDAH